MHLLAAIVFLGAQATPLDAKVSLTLQAMSANAAIEQLSKTAGLPLFGSATLSRDIVCIRLKEAPLRETMAKLAECLDATWETEGAARRLVRKDSQVLRLRKLEFEEDVKLIEAAQARIAATEAGFKPWNQATAEALATQLKVANKDPQHPEGESPHAYQLSVGLPMPRIARQVALSIPAKEYAALEEGVMVVWANAPTPSQRPLPPRLSNLVSKIQADLAIWQSTQQKTAPSPDHDPELSAVHKVLIKALRERFDARIRIEVDGYNARGQQVADAVTYVSPIEEEEMRRRSAILRAAPVVTGPSIELDEEGALLVGYRPGREGVQKLPAAFLAKALNVTESEPLSLVSSKSLIRLAEIQDLNLVALLSDNPPLGAHWFNINPISPKNYLEKLAIFQNKAVVSDGWLTVKPERPLKDQAIRIDRPILASFLKLRREKASPTIEQLAYHAWRMPPLEENLLVAFWLQFTTGEAENLLWRDYDILRLLGSLSIGQQQAAKAGGIPFRSFTPDQLSVIRKLVYGGNANFQPKDAEDPNWFSEERMLQTEPTEFMPRGLLPDMLCSIKEQKTIVAVAPEVRVGNSMRDEARMSPESYAREKFRQSKQTTIDPEMAPFKVDLDSVYPARQRRVTVTFDLTPKVELSFDLNELSNKSAKPIGYSDLPESFRKEVEAELELLKRGVTRTRRGEGGGVKLTPR